MTHRGFGLIPVILAGAAVLGLLWTGSEFARTGQIPFMSVPGQESAGTGADINFVGGQAYYLSGSGVAATDTSINLTSFTDPNGTELTMSNFGDIGYATLEPGTSRQEFISFTGVTQDSGSTRATLTGVTRGLKFVSPYTADTALRKAHTGGSILIVSNPPQLYEKLARKGSAETITGVWTFSSTSPAIYDGAFTVASTSQQLPPASWVFANFLNKYTNQTMSGVLTLSATSTFSNGGLLGYSIDSNSNSLAIANKGYVDSVAIAGASDANTTTKGIVEEATVAEVNAGTATGGTGAKLFITPEALSQSTYASTTSIKTSDGATQSFTNTTGKVMTIAVNGNWAGTNTNADDTVELKMGGQTVQALDISLLENGRDHPFMLQYATTTATSTNISVTAGTASLTNIRIITRSEPASFL